MGEGVDAELEGFEAGREIFDAVELVSPRALGAFDVAVELGPLRRQDEEAQVALSACLLELGPELRPAIDLDALDAEGDLGDELVEEGCGAARGCAAGDEGDGPLRHRVVSREVLDGLVGSDVDEEGVDLDEFARPDRLQALGQALSVALAHDAQAAWTGFATKHRHGRDDASRHELRQDAPDHRRELLGSPNESARPRVRINRRLTKNGGSFPTKWSREFFDAEQGILGHLTRNQGSGSGCLSFSRAFARRSM